MVAKIFELVNAHGGASFSPFVLTALLMLKHKKIEFESVPLTFVEVGPTIKELTKGEWELVPTIQFDNGDIVFDSPKIADYLDKHYPNHKLKLNNPAIDEFLTHLKSAVGETAFRLVIMDIYNSIDEENKKYMRAARERGLGVTLEEFSANPEDNIDLFFTHTRGLTDILEKSPFIEGEVPAYADYVAMGMVHWIRAISPVMYARLIVQHPSPVLREWVGRMDALFDGYLPTLKTV